MVYLLVPNDHFTAYMFTIITKSGYNEQIWISELDCILIFNNLAKRGPPKKTVKNKSANLFVSVAFS